MCWLNFKETVRAYCSFSAAPCGGAVTGQSGVIESNGYPTQPYTDDLFCEWRLRGPLGHYLTIRFEDFNLQNSSGCERDFVEIWENHTSGQWICLLSFGRCLFSPVTHSASEIPSFPRKARVRFLRRSADQLPVDCWAFLFLISYPRNSGVQSPGVIVELILGPH